MSMKARVAKRYSKALVDAVQEAGTLESELAFLRSFCEMTDTSDELSRFFLNVTVKAKQKTEMVKALCEEMKASDLMKRFLLLLAAKGRLDCLDEIQSAVIERVNKLQNIRDVSIVSSTPLSDDSRTGVVTALSEKLSSKIRLQEQVDASIWGGAVVRVGSKVYDGSLKGKMKRLREELVKEN